MDPYQKEVEEYLTYGGKFMWRQDRERLEDFSFKDWHDAATSQGTLTPSKAGRSQECIFPYRFGREYGHANTLISTLGYWCLTSGLFNCKRAALCCFKWSVVWPFVLANTGSQSSIYDLFSDTWKCFLILIAFWFIYLFFFSMVVYYRILNIDCLFRGSLQPHVIRHRGNHHHYQPCELLSVWCLPRCV